MAARAAVYSCWVISPACNAASRCASRVDKLGGGAGGVFCCVLPGGRHERPVPMLGETFDLFLAEWPRWVGDLKYQSALARFIRA